MVNMNLSRGNCILCTNCNKIVNPPDASSITKLLPHVLEGFLDDQKLGTVTFQPLKICPSCLQDILFLVEYKSHIKDYSETSNNCSVCLCDNNLVSVKDWNNFEVIIKKVLKVEKQKCYIICLKCIKYFETLDRIKTNFIKQNPKLALKNSPKKKITKDSSENSYSTPNKKRWSTNSHSNKGTEGNHEDDLEKALRHLKPLQLLNFDLDQFQKDEKLLNQIAFVKLQSLKAAHKHRNHINRSDNSHNTSGTKHHSFFKIKLKMRPSFKNKKITKVSPKKIQKQSTVDLELSGKKLSVKLLKMDLDKLTEEHSFNSAVRSTGLTPTKASLKFIEEPLSSSKKRKSVTFASCIDEVLDEVVTKEENSVQSPMKSLLKRSSDLLEPTESINEENGMVSKNKDYDNSDNNVDSDEDDISNKLDPFTEHIKNNSTSIFDSLKSDGVQNNNSIENTVLDKNDDSESQIESDTRNYSENDESQEVSKANEVELQSTIDDDSSKNGLTEYSQDKQESNEENFTNEDEATRKRKLSDDFSVSSELDSTLEPEEKRLKLGEEEKVIINCIELDGITEDNCVTKSSDIVGEKVIATIVLNSQEDTCIENGKNVGICETDLGLRATEI